MTSCERSHSASRTARCSAGLMAAQRCGQRALGARSIIGDPRHRRNLARINGIKGREVWRPLAPSVHADFAEELFAGVLPPDAEFMLAACPLRDFAARRIPACTHVDLSARPQIVSSGLTSPFWR